MASINDVDVECHSGASDHYNDETKQLVDEIVNNLIDNAVRIVDVHRGHLSNNDIQTLSQIEEILMQNDVQIDNVQMKRLRGIWAECDHNLNQFATALLDRCHTVNDDDSASSLPHRIVQVILHEFIKNSNLNTENVVHIASILIPKLDPNGNVDMDEVTRILVDNDISGRVFAKGTSEYMNAAKFSRLFKPMSSWKDNKSVFSRFWRKINKWRLVEVQQTQKTEEQKYQDHQMGDECKYQISECPQCQKIKSVLIKYQSKHITALKQEKQKPPPHSVSISQSATGLTSLYDNNPLLGTETLDDEYTVVSLLDDFYHLIHDHGVGQAACRLTECSEFVAQSISCNLNECQFARRHYGRRRSVQRGGDVPHGDDWRNDILRQIHCYILHSIDFSELSRCQQAEIETENREIKEDDDKHTNAGDEPEQHPVNNNYPSCFGSKFVSDAQSEPAEDTEYTEGIRYWYWAQNQFMPKSAVPVTRKFNDLKEEMVSGGRVQNHAWNRLMKLCVELVGTKFSRNTTANGIGEDIYGIKAGVPFDIGHLVALKLYTDYDDLNHLFCDQFRVRDANEDHSKWWNMGKLLAECVQCFGKLLISKKVKYYRGLSKPFLFSRFVARFHAPLSTSKSVCL